MSLLLRVLNLTLILGLSSLPAQAAELQQIVQRGYLIVAVKDNLRPLGFRDASGQLQGLEIDIARQLAKELLGNADAVRLQPVANVDRLRLVTEGQVDLAIANLTATAARSRIVQFTSPYYFSGLGILTKDPRIQRLTDLANRPVALLQGSRAIAQFRFLLPSAKLVPANSYQAAKMLLDSGKVVAVVADGTVLTGWVQGMTGYRLLPKLLSAEPLAIALPKGLQYQDLQLRLQDILRRWQNQGWLSERVRYWGLPPGDQIDGIIPKLK